MRSTWKETGLTLGGIALGVISLIPNQDRILVASVFLMAIVFTALNDFSRKMEFEESEIKRLQEKLNIHEQVIELKADIKSINNRLRKTER